MARAYTMTRRAAQQAETHLRIVEAAIALHGEMGPAQTSLSQVAERAAVQRHTLYAHFPDERSLLLACSGLHLERNPLPDPENWNAIAGAAARLKTGLAALYRWYDANADLAGCVLRDAEFHEPTREVVALRIGPHLQACRRVLCEGLTERQSAVLDAAMGFATWRSLARRSGLDSDTAADVMTKAVVANS